MHTEMDILSRIAASPAVCRTCIHLDADYLGISDGFVQICLKGHSMTAETCSDANRGDRP